MKRIILLFTSGVVPIICILAYNLQVYNPHERDRRGKNTKHELLRNVERRIPFENIGNYKKINADRRSLLPRESNTIRGGQGMRNVVQLGLPARHRLPSSPDLPQNTEYNRLASHDNLYWNSTNSKPFSQPITNSHRQTFTQISSNNAAPNARKYIGTDRNLDSKICDHPNGFLRKQKALCRRYLHLMESVLRGYFMGLHECQYQFSTNRWNCRGHNLTIPTISRRKQRLRFRKSQENPDLKRNKKNDRIKTYMDRLLSKGTRESAYVLAVTSAGVSHAVTKACSSGRHENCGCDRTVYDHPREPNFEWSGCSDNIHFGAAFSRKFLDVRERKRVRRRPKFGLTNLHNNHVGRQAVINAMQVQCKCHGVSGSCEMRTCWRSLPSFRSLGATLRKRFHSAIQVDYVHQKLTPLRAKTNKAQRRYRSPTMQTNANLDNEQLMDKALAITENDLLYISESPTYCDHDPGFGSIGTHGRQCDEDTEDFNSCGYLCCNRGFRRETFVQDERCNCKFQWCCKVVCQTCRKTVTVSTCN